MEYHAFLKIILIFIYLVYENKGFEVEIEDIELVYSTNYIKPGAFANLDSDGDKNTVTIEFQFINDLSLDNVIEVKILGLSQGEYDMDTGLYVALPICDAIKEQVILAPIMTRIGFTGDNCSPKKGKYSLKNYYPSLELLPDSFPQNKYMVKISIIDGDTVMFALSIYVDLS